MKQILKSWWPACVALALLIAFSTHSQSQTGSAVPDPQLTILISEIASQQATIIANHGKINAKIVEVEENVRQARIFAARGGRGGAGGTN